MNILLALLPLLGVVIGAAMQYWFSRAAESRKQMELLQSQSYVDYLRAVTDSAHADSSQNARAAQARAAEAKARIAIYGTSGVIAALAAFEATGAVIDSSPARQAFTALVGAMRQRRDAPPANDIALLLFGAGHE